jgi:hypothetical protein
MGVAGVIAMLAGRPSWRWYAVLREDDDLPGSLCESLEHRAAASLSASEARRWDALPSMA